MLPIWDTNNKQNDLSSNPAPFYPKLKEMFKVRFYHPIIFHHLLLPFFCSTIFRDPPCMCRCAVSARCLKPIRNPLYMCINVVNFLYIGTLAAMASVRMYRNLHVYSPMVTHCFPG